MPEDPSDRTENKHFPLLLCTFLVISDPLFGRYSHRGVATAPHTLLPSPAITRGYSSGLAGRNSHDSDFSLFSTRCARRRWIHLAVGDHLGALLRVGSDRRGGTWARAAQLSDGHAHRGRGKASVRPDQRPLLCAAPQRHRLQQQCKPPEPDRRWRRPPHESRGPIRRLDQAAPAESFYPETALEECSSQRRSRGQGGENSPYRSHTA